MVTAEVKLMKEPVGFVMWLLGSRNSKVNCGANVHDAKLLAHSHYESFEAQLQDETLEAETLAHVLTVAEEKTILKNKPEPPQQTCCISIQRERSKLR